MCVRALIAAGADVNRADQNGRTPFTCALFASQRRILKILLHAGAYVNAPDANRRSNATWALVDEIEAAGGWENYVTRRRAALVRVFSGKVSKYISAHIVSFEPPGGSS